MPTNLSPKVISLVPSWTETLIHCGVNVVGRTRFCLYPKEKCADIPIVGGTKSFEVKKMTELQADFVLLDKEENTKSMAEASPAPLLTTHVTSLQSAASELLKLSQAFHNNELKNLSLRYEAALKKHYSPTDFFGSSALLQPIPASKWQGLELIYLIWNRPWIAVGKNTFVKSVLDLFHLPMAQLEEKYPELDINKFTKDILFLCSSEPYPFPSKLEELKELPGEAVLVDGEVLSWFGIRNLLFLEKLKNFYLNS